MQDIHGIREPVRVGIDPAFIYLIFWGFLGLVLLAVVFFLGRKWWKGRKKQPGSLMLPPPVPPFEAARNALTLLAGRQMTDPRIFYFELTRVLRKYIGDRFHTSAVEMTTQEFVKSLGTLEIDKRIRQEIPEFLYRCDPIKYAGICPDRTRVDRDIRRVERIIGAIEQDTVRKEAVV